MEDNRTILHVDMDAFFASVEQLDHPEWRGKPVIVGADPKEGKGRGVVSACSYEAREFGIHSALPITRAWRKCPDGIYVKPRMKRYAELSRQIFALFYDFTEKVEPISVDEAFMDVTGSVRLFGDGVAIAHQIKARVRDELGLVASVGVAPNKFLAKVASDLEKPDGLVVVKAEEVQVFLRDLPIRKLWGVGEKTGQILTRLGIRTIGEVAKLKPAQIRGIIGDHGVDLLRLARGEDEREVIPGREVKSIGNEVTFLQDTSDVEQIHGTLLGLADKVGGRLRRGGVETAGITLKFRDETFRTRTRSAVMDPPTTLTDDLYEMALTLLDRVGWNGKTKVRLVGLTAHKLVDPGDVAPRQMEMFVAETEQEKGTDHSKKQEADKAVDTIRDKFGTAAIRRGATVGGGKGKSED